MARALPRSPPLSRELLNFRVSTRAYRRALCRLSLKTFKRVNAGARRRATIVYRIILATAKLHTPASFFIRQIEPRDSRVFQFNPLPLSVPLSPSPAPPSPRPCPCRSVAREVITKLHECVHRISIKTKTQFPPRENPRRASDIRRR